MWKSKLVLKAEHREGASSFSRQKKGGPRPCPTATLMITGTKSNPADCQATSSQNGRNGRKNKTDGKDSKRAGLSSRVRAPGDSLDLRWAFYWAVAVVVRPGWETAVWCLLSAGFPLGSSGIIKKRSPKTVISYSTPTLKD